ncbi:MAG TPA: BamA/TamA family outer membrane protein [Bacteroidota bacterium]|nr:BamA/TamA family outer membrane protein [Bacteroidota bacterium]
MIERPPASAGSGKKAREAASRLEWIVAPLLLFAASGTASPQSEPGSSDSSSGSRRGVVGAPYVKYEPETGLAGGVVALYYFHLTSDSADGSADRPSSVSGGATYTQKKQISTGIDYDFYFASGVYHLSGGFDYKRIPYDFYGVGNRNPTDPVDSYTPLWRGGDAEFTRNFLRTPLGEGLNAGLGMEFRWDDILSSLQGKILQTGSVPGSKGGLSAGMGIVVNFDTRDNIFSSHEGEFCDFKATFYGRAIGGSFNFNRYTLDLRKFIPVGDTHTIAVQTLEVFVKGVEPFYTMAQLGGDNNLRGYFQGRQRNTDMSVLQAEYRLPLVWRFGLALFADAGEVAGALDAFRYSGIHYSAGAGIRFVVIPEEHLGVRLDYGIGSDSSELYFSILEAF